MPAALSTKATRIDKAIEDGDLYKNKELSRVMDETKQAGKALHLLGLLSDGGVHSHIEHLLALICMAKVKGDQGLCACLLGWT